MIHIQGYLNLQQAQLLLKPEKKKKLKHTDLP